MNKLDFVKISKNYKQHYPIPMTDEKGKELCPVSRTEKNMYIDFSDCIGIVTSELNGRFSVHWLQTGAYRRFLRCSWWHKSELMLSEKFIDVI